MGLWSSGFYPSTLLCFQTLFFLYNLSFKVQIKASASFTAAFLLSMELLYRSHFLAFLIFANLFYIVENLNRLGFALCRTAYIRQNQYLSHFIAAPVLHLG